MKTVTKLIEFSRSTVSNNLRELRYREFCDKYMQNKVNDEDVCTVGVIKELLYIKNECLSSPLSPDETEVLLEFLCIN